jgi:hypothetical protein
MSLLNTASPWNNDEAVPKKRTPNMINTFKNTIQSMNDPSPSLVNTEPTSISAAQTINQERGTKVNELLNKMNLSLDNGGSKLANFNPPPQPLLNQRKPNASGKTATNELSPKELLPQNVFNPMNNENGKATQSSNGVNYSANDSNLGMLSNYNNIYNGNMTPIENPSHLKPYYSKMGISSGQTPSSSSVSMDNKLLEKLNYMIHLLEEQQNEKTSNITEEFILYTFLGVFIIYIVDSFAKSGKYVR